MRSETIACKYPNHSISQVWLEEALKTHSTCVGFALAKDGIVLHKNFVPTEDPLLKAIEKTQEKFKKEHVFFYFAHADDADKEYDIDSYQPFPILKKGEETLLAVMLDGEFPAYAKEGKNTSAYHFVEDYLKPKIVEMYGDISNLEKLCTRLDGPSFRKDIQFHLEPRGYMLVLPARGKAFSISNNKIGGAYSWGLTSKSLNIASDFKDEDPPFELTKVAEPVASNKPLTFKEKKAREAALKSSTAVPEPVVEPKADPLKKDVPKSESPFHERDGGLWLKPPAGASYKDAKHFWSRHTHLPHPPNDDPKALFAGFPVTDLAADSPFFQFLAEKDRPANPETSAFKNAFDQAKKKKEASMAKAETDEAPGLLTVNEKREILEARKDNKLWGGTPEELAEMTKKNESFTEQTGIEFEDLLHAKRAFVFRRNKRELILMFEEVRLKLIETLKSKGVDKPPVVAPKDKEKLTMPTEPAKPLTFREKRALAAKAA